MIGQSINADIMANLLLLIYLPVIIFALFFDVVKRANTITRDILLRSVIIFWLVGIYFGVAFDLLSILSPESFRLVNQATGPGRIEWMDYFYFSFTTVSTLGLDDIISISLASKSMTVIEGIIGVFYIAIFVTKLVLSYYVNLFQLKRVID
jgi:Ion channel